MKTIVESPELAIGATLAFNSIGWDSQNILFNLADARARLGIGDRTRRSRSRPSAARRSSRAAAIFGHRDLPRPRSSPTSRPPRRPSPPRSRTTPSAIGVDIVVAMNRVGTQVEASSRTRRRPARRRSRRRAAASRSSPPTTRASTPSSTHPCSRSRRRCRTRRASRSRSASPATRSRPRHGHDRGRRLSARDRRQRRRLGSAELGDRRDLDAPRRSPSPSASRRALAFSGGGATAVNKIAGDTTATIAGGTITATGAAPDEGAIAVTATNSSTIAATVAALAVAVGGGPLRHDAGGRDRLLARAQPDRLAGVRRLRPDLGPGARRRHAAQRRPRRHHLRREHRDDRPRPSRPRRSRSRPRATAPSPSRSAGSGRTTRSARSSRPPPTTPASSPATAACP